MTVSLSQAARRRGFTLVELLVVMAIVAVLVTFLIGALFPQKVKAQRSKTAALLKAIQTALDQYYADFRDYPPDGYDQELAWGSTTVAQCKETGQAVGIQLPMLPSPSGCFYAGSGCLIYFLCYPITNFYTIGADQGTPDPRNQRAQTVGPYLSSLKDDDISVKAWAPDFTLGIHPSTFGKPGGYQQIWAQGEIVDAFGFPIHYDKVKDLNDTSFFNAGRFSGNNYCHTDLRYMTEQLSGRIYAPEYNKCPTDTHLGGTTALQHGEPRSTVETDGCYTDRSDAKPRNVGAYDLWAHGDSWANGRTAITNWKSQ